MNTNDKLLGILCGVVIVTLFTIALSTRPRKEVRSTELLKQVEVHDRLAREYMILLYESGYRTGAINTLNKQAWDEETWKRDSTAVQQKIMKW